MKRPGEACDDVLCGHLPLKPAAEGSISETEAILLSQSQEDRNPGGLLNSSLSLTPRPTKSLSYTSSVS